MLSGTSFLDAFVYHQKSYDETISIKEQMNLLSYNANLTINDDFQFQTTQHTLQEDQKQKEEDATKEEQAKKEVDENAIVDEEPTPKQEETPSAEDTGKKVYIYNTHQSEAYASGETVMDAAAILGNALEEKGIHVVLETADFGAYANSKGWDYNQSYAVSNAYLNDALVTYGGFDMIIDLHRDAIPREASYLDTGDKTYAKLMPVIGGLSENAPMITERASTLSDIMNAKVHGIMRSTMTREAWYNQQVSDKTILIECGGDVNPFEEVKNSMEVLAEGIYEVLMR